jgi:hypothetical protein
MNDHTRLTQLYQVVIGNGAEGLVEIVKAVGLKMDDHIRWHLRQRLTIVVAIAGWTVAIVLGVIAMVGGQ